jgi:pimeloyl-ACP methyl ester carboxylesterase
VTVVGLALVACGGGEVAQVDTEVATTTVPTTEDVTTTEPGGAVTLPPTDPDPGEGADDPDADPEVPPIEWEEYSATVDTAIVPVPLDHSDPTGEMIELFVARHPARDPDNRIGSLLVNPGGPGFGGSDFAIYAAQIYDPALLDRFDIVGWDPRGTGVSSPAIDCIDDFDPYVAEIDITPETDAERNTYLARSQEFAELCVSGNDGFLTLVGTNNTARDMDWLRRALGEETISYFGFSYGSELGATWATLFPDTVRAAVLDGAADPNADDLESSKQQLRGFETSLSTFLAQCSSRSSCAFHNGGDAEGAFDALALALDADPVPTVAGRPEANLAVMINGVIQAMYSQSYWPRLEDALAAAADGDGSGLLALHDSYFQRRADGTYGNQLEAFQVISCMDTDERRSVDDENKVIDELRAIAPRLVPEGSVGSYFCTFLPTAGDPRADITGAGAGPIVVIGTTGDAATPLESTRAMAATLEDGRLVVVEAEQHTGYGVNRCVVDVVNDYLIDLVPPDDGTECR